MQCTAHSGPQPPHLKKFFPKTLVKVSPAALSSLNNYGCTIYKTVFDVQHSVASMPSLVSEMGMALLGNIRVQNFPEENISPCHLQSGKNVCFVVNRPPIMPEAHESDFFCEGKRFLRCKGTAVKASEEERRKNVETSLILRY